MTVAELIEELKKHPMDRTVIISQYETDYEDVYQVKEANPFPNYQDGPCVLIISGD